MIEQQTTLEPNLRGFRKWKARIGDEVTVPWPNRDGSPGFFDRWGVCESRGQDHEGSDYWIVRWADSGELSTPIWNGDSVVVVKTLAQRQKERKTAEKMALRSTGNLTVKQGGDSCLT